MNDIRSRIASFPVTGHVYWPVHHSCLMNLYIKIKLQQLCCMLMPGVNGTREMSRSWFRGTASDPFFPICIVWIQRWITVPTWRQTFDQILIHKWTTAYITSYPITSVLPGQLLAANNQTSSLTAKLFLKGFWRTSQASWTWCSCQAQINPYSLKLQTVYNSAPLFAKLGFVGKRYRCSDYVHKSQRGWGRTRFFKIFSWCWWRNHRHASVSLFTFILHH